MRATPRFFLRGGSLAGPSLLLVSALLASRSVAAAASSPPSEKEHDPSVAGMIEHFVKRGVYYNPKQAVRRAVPGDPSTMLGVFATDDIHEGELLCSIPWNCTINAGYRVDDPDHLICDTVRNLVKEMRLGDESDFGPYVNYLLDQRVGQLPSAWSDAGKDLLLKVLDGDALPPFEATSLIDNDWRGHCGGSDDPYEENAAMLVIQRAEDDLVLPVYDFYNHRNGEYLNTVNKRINKKRGQVKFKVYAAKDIPRGAEIYISYNMCANCGGRADSYGTPEMFQDYGFVEMFPQRWIFEEEGFKFDLNEKKDSEGSPIPGELELTWMRNGRPKRAERRKAGVVSFHRHILRLEQLRRVEHSARNEEVPDYEWDHIWNYEDAMVTAMKLAIVANGEDHSDAYHGGGDNHGATCKDGDGTCDAAAPTGNYDALEEDENDDDFYDEAPYPYTMSCDTETYLQFPGYKVMEDFETLYQAVEFFNVPDGDVCLELDSVIQACHKYRPHYHELVLDVPARFMDQLKRVLFVGGGDSMLLAEAIKYPSLELVVGLELEQEVTRKTFKHMRTQPLFHDRRVEWWFGDAVKSLRLLPKEYFGSFDLVLVDLSETVASFAVSTHLDMLEAIALLVKPEGIMVKNEWVYLDKMSNMFKYTARVNIQDIPYTCDQAMTMGSNKVDFLNHIPKDHGIQRRLIGPHVEVDERFYMFHDYRKNDVRPVHDSCVLMDYDDHESDLEHEKSEGIMMIVNAENTTAELSPFGTVVDGVVADLRWEGLNVLSTVSSPSGAANSDGEVEGDGGAVVIFMREGYVTVRTWPSRNYVAFDMFLWAKFHKLEAVRDLLLHAVGTDDDSYSDYRIVAGGMLGTESWEEDRDMIGPRFAQRKACKETYPDEEEEGKDDNAEQGEFSKDSVVDAVLGEGKDLLVRNRENDLVVVCGAKDEPCQSLEAISKNAVEEKVQTLWTCPDIAGDAQSDEDVSSKMVLCEHEVSKLLEEWGKVGAFIIDDSAPLTMIQILNSILGSEVNRDKMLADQVIFLELMGEGNGETWSRRHAFLDRIRKEIGWDPLFKAEVVVSTGGGGAEEGERMEMGIMSVEDTDFYTHLYNVTKRLHSKGLDARVRKVSGGRWTYQENYNPTTFTKDDYDQSPAIEQFARQEPFGRTSVFHLEVENNEEGEHADAAAGIQTMSRADVESALFFALAENRIPVHEYKTVTEVGDGFVAAALSPEGWSATVVFDGRSHVNVNVFSHDQDEEKSDKMIGAFAWKLPFKLVQRDEQPRGTERVINFMSDIQQTETTADERRLDADAAGEEAMVAHDEGDALYECPNAEVGAGKNDIAGYFNYYDKDNERHAENSQADDDYFTVGFRDVNFGGRVQTFSKLKKMTTKYKAKAYGDNLSSGDTIYEGACGEGFNLLLTLEILREKRGIENLTAYGSDYLAASTDVANKLFAAQASEHHWIHKGRFCQGDSTQLDFVPADSFDLAFTYVDPLVDPLRRHGYDIPFADRVDDSKELCESDDEADHVLVQKEQDAQEDWHASWVEELIRIVKPGKVAIIEDIDTPVCDETSDWGGVSVGWWRDAVSKYGWDVDPDSIEIVEGAWYGNRYNVLMRKNPGLHEESAASSGTEKHARRNVTFTTRDKSTIDTCPRRHWNEEFNAYNVMEVDIDRDIIKEIWEDYSVDVRPHLNSGKSTDDFCLVTPYNTDTDTWDNNNGVMRSDIKWFSVRNEKTYDKYLRYVDRLGLRELVKGSWVSAEEVTIYAMFFIPRSFSTEPHYHLDWSDEIHTQVMTFLIPVNDFDIHLKYKDVDGEERDYEYKVGKAITFGGGFWHATGLGKGEEEDVLLCIYLGADDPKIWEYAQDNIADELEYYMSPISGFTRNEIYPDKSICQ